MEQKILRGRYVVIDPSRLPHDGMIKDGAVLISGNTVAEAGTWEELKGRYPDVQVVGTDRHMILPGLVNSHHHGRGISGIQLGARDDYLERWLIDFWSMKPLDVYLDTLFANMQMIRSGVTTAIQLGNAREWTGSEKENRWERMEQETRDALRAYADVGMRVAYAVGVEDDLKFVLGDNEEFLATLPENLAEPARELVAPVNQATIDRYFEFIPELAAEHDGDDTVRILYSTTWPTWCSDVFLDRIAAESERTGLGIHTHALESLGEREYALDTKGMSVIQYLQERGILGPRTSLAHGIWLTEDDISLCVETGTSVCHNPGSNLRLRNGIAPISRMFERGVNIGIGTDSWGLNSNDDLLQELRLACNLVRLPRGQQFRSCPDCFDLLRMVTINGAQAATLSEGSGQLMPGSPADAVLIDFERMTAPYLDPTVHPVEAFVYLARRDHVDSVTIAGETVLRNGQFVNVDENEVISALSTIAALPPNDELRDFCTMIDALRPYVDRYYESWKEDSEFHPSYTVNAVD